VPADLPFNVFYKLEPGTPLVRSPVGVRITATSGNMTHTRDLSITITGATIPGVR